LQVINVNGVCYEYSGVLSFTTPDYIQTSGSIDSGDCDECFNTNGGIVYCPVLAECCKDTKKSIVVGVDVSTFTPNDTIVYSNTCYQVNSFTLVNGVPLASYATGLGLGCVPCMAIHTGECL
jgi:hypothetical protein